MSWSGFVHYGAGAGAAPVYVGAGLEASVELSAVVVDAAPAVGLAVLNGDTVQARTVTAFSVSIDQAQHEVIKSC